MLAFRLNGKTLLGVLNQSQQLWYRAVEYVVNRFHDRTPLLLEKDQLEAWEHGDLKLAASLLQPAKGEVIQAWPVSRRVNSSKTYEFDASLVERAEQVLPL